VFEIGSTLRAARESQGLERTEIERVTRIRQRYIAALEEERFELVPGRAYVKGFLRQYADFLGLDGQRFVDEFNSRYPEPEVVELRPRAPARIGRAWTPRLALVVVAITAIALLGALAWGFGIGHRATPSSTSAPTAAAPKHAVPSAAPRPSPAAHTQTAHLLLRARGRCWVSARVGSEGGHVLYEGTLATGDILRYTLAPRRPRLWLRIGAPWNLQVALNRKRLGVGLSGPGNIVVTRRGIATA
jgi:transcriptional regulator with XRE-family HTH domain